MKEAFKVWRLNARIATLEQQLEAVMQYEHDEFQRSADEEETRSMEWLTPLNQEGTQETELASGRPSMTQTNQKKKHGHSATQKKTPVQYSASKPPTQQTFKISDTVGVNININQFNTLSADQGTELGRKSKGSLTTAS